MARSTDEPRGVGLHAPSDDTSKDALYSRRWLVLASVGMGTYINVLDSSLLNVSLPVITRALNTDIGTVQWVVTAYLLVITSLLLVAGRLADIVGQKRVYTAGLVVFTVGSAFCGVAQSIEQLIGYRMLQGIGSASVQGLGSAITVSAFPSSERGKVLGIQATTVALGGITGPLFGGIITDWLGWRWLFFLRIPLGLLVLLTSLVLIREVHPANRRERFDIVGAVALFVTISSLLLALNQGRTWGWGSPLILGLFAVAAVFGTTFVVVERRVSAPMVPLGIFRNRVFTGASLSSMCNFMGTSASVFLMPFYLQRVLGYSPSEAGLLLIASAVVMSVAAPVSGALSDRLGSHVLSPVGLGVVGFALFQLSTLGPTAQPIDVIGRLGLLGLGMGTFSSPNNSALMSSAPHSLLGLASAVMASMRNLGNVFGVAVASTILATRTAYYTATLSAAGASGEMVQQQAFLNGFREALLVAATFTMFGLFAALLRGPHRQPSG